MGRQDSHRVERVQRSRSSPDRRSNSPRERARSPSTSILRTKDEPAAPAVLTPMIYNYSSNASSAVAYYSTSPPAMPMYLVPFPPYPVALLKGAQVFDHSDSQLEIKETMNKESKKIARHVIRTLLRIVDIAVADKQAEPDVVTQPAIVSEPDAVTQPDTDVATADNNVLSDTSPMCHSIASQTKTKSSFTRKAAVTDVDVLSISSEAFSVESEETWEWAGDVRALRDSHVRLVLQQLRQLRDVERLRRSLRRAHSVSPHSYNEPNTVSVPLAS